MPAGGICGEGQGGWREAPTRPLAEGCGSEPKCVCARADAMRQAEQRRETLESSRTKLPRHSQLEPSPSGQRMPLGQRTNRDGGAASSLHPSSPAKPAALDTEIAEPCAAAKDVEEAMEEEEGCGVADGSSGDSCSPRCPAGHSLTLKHPDTEQLCCDACSAPLTGQQFLSCGDCDYDLCLKCSGQTADAAAPDGGSGTANGSSGGKIWWITGKVDDGKAVLATLRSNLRTRTACLLRSRRLRRAREIRACRMADLALPAPSP
jgi:hypothetical protein